MSKNVAAHLQKQFAKAKISEAESSTIQEFKNQRKEDSKISSFQQSDNSTKEESKSPIFHEKKKARIIESKYSRNVEAQKRIPVNMMMREDYDRAIKILAAERRVRPCVILEEALRKYLKSVNINLSNKDVEIPKD